MSAFHVNQRIVWHHEMRGGYGYTEPVDGVVTKITERRVQIEVPLKKGGTKRVCVSPGSLEARE